MPHLSPLFRSSQPNSKFCLFTARLFNYCLLLRGFAETTTINIRELMQLQQHGKQRQQVTNHLIFFQELIIRHHIYVSKEKVKVFAHPPLKVTLESFITWSSRDCKEIKCNRKVDASAELMFWAGLFKAGLR